MLTGLPSLSTKLPRPVVVGASLTGMMVTVTLAVETPPLPSLILYMIVSVPLKLVAGVYVIVPLPLITTLPLPAVADETVRGSKSGSVSLLRMLMILAVSSLVVAVSSFAVGAGLVTVQVKLVETVPPGLPSLAVTTTVYGPDCEAFLSIVPEIMPVLGSIVMPAGRPVAE